MKKLFIGIDFAKEKFDVAIDSQMILKSMVWTMFCGAKRRIIAKDAREGSIIGGNEWIEKIFDKKQAISGTVSISFSTADFSSIFIISVSVAGSSVSS